MDDDQNIDLAVTEKTEQGHAGKNQSKAQTAFKKPASKTTPLELVVALTNGLGVGLLLGVLLGLAVSPVVSGMIGTLSSLLVVLLGLNDKYLTVVKSLRIGSFGIFAVAGILLGMHIRTHDALSPSATDLMREYTDAGFDSSEAKYYVALKVFEYVPVGWFGTNVADTIALSQTTKSHKSVLFSSEVNVAQCNFLTSAQRNWKKSKVMKSFKMAGGTWAELALGLEPEMPDQVLIDGLLALRDSFCGLGKSGKVKIISSGELLNLTQNNSLQEFAEAMQSSDENWRVILENTKNVIPDKNQKKFYLIIIKTFTDENNK
jgi:hypothetical protein